MSSEPTLSPADEATFDALIADAVDQCEAAGISDDALLQCLASELAMAEVQGRKQAGDVQAGRILRHMAYVGMLSWMEDEEAAGRPCFDVESTLRRLFADYGQRPSTQA